VPELDFGIGGPASRPLGPSRPPRPVPAPGARWASRLGPSGLSRDRVHADFGLDRRRTGPHPWRRSGWTCASPVSTGGWPGRCPGRSAAAARSRGRGPVVRPTAAIPTSTRPGGPVAAPAGPCLGRGARHRQPRPHRPPLQGPSRP